MSNGNAGDKGGFFSTESPFYRFLSRLFDMIKLNAMWLIFSGVFGYFLIPVLLRYFFGFSTADPIMIIRYIPFLTIGAATTAAFSITLRMVDEQEGYIAEPFIAAFKDNFIQGNILGIIFIIGIYGLYLDVQFYQAAEKLGQSNLLYMVLGVILAVMLFLHLIYAFALQARYENTLINILRNSRLIAIRFLLRTIFLVLLLGVLIVIFLWNSTTLFLGILVGVPTLFFAISASAMRVFRELEAENEDSQDMQKEA